MDKRVLEKLEFPKIQERLDQLCASGLGRELVWDLAPVIQIEEMAKLQQETSEARNILRLVSQVPLGGVSDVRTVLKKAKMGGVLDPGALLAVADTLAAGRRMRDFFQDEKVSAPLLEEYAAGIKVLGKLEREIRFAVANDEELADRASEKLHRLRRQIRSTNNQIKDRLENMVRSRSYQKYLQEPIVTVRGNRYVVPVKQEYRNFVPGLVHDQSGSGATLFIEPMPVVELNNKLREYQRAEAEEINRILAALSQVVAQDADEITVTLSALARLDFAFAKGRYSLEIDGVEPKFNDEGYIDIIQARHPLLGDQVVPIDIYLGRVFRILVITGPNTGGKTVTLKTVGLFAVMGQAGLHLPAAAGTEMTVFDQVFVDIGDEQSIEQSLSTFSGHMKNIIGILKDCTAGSLVLLDELGAGTDPTEGAALGMAILDHLHQRNTRVVATTHYSELKTFAYNFPQVENASVEFDAETLQPTFNLLIGIPGRSNAFEIARRLGLPQGIVDRARDFMSEGAVRVEELIKSLEKDRVRAFHDRVEAGRARDQVEKLVEQYERERAKLAEQRNQTLTKARQEAMMIVNRARQEAERILEGLKRETKGLLERERTQASQGARQELNKLREEMEGQLANLVPGEEGEVPRDLKSGETVHISHLNKRGQVLEPPAGDQVLVQVGVMRVTVSLDQVRRVTGEKEEIEPTPTGSGRISGVKAHTVAPEMDLRGLTAEEAVYQVEKYLDDAYLAGLDQVFLIHGKGTGVLRKTVQDLVASHSHVKSYRLGGYREGGTGVTVVELDK